MWQAAASMAARWHRGQSRKDGETPYVAHAFRVTMTIRDLFGFDDQAILAAALLHDLIEDTGADYDDIHDAFGEEVADLVAAMTKDMRLIEEVREQEYDRQLAAASWKARLIKLADVYDNLSEAATPEQRRKLIGKAERALALTEQDGELVAARQAVIRLVREMRKK